jgi:hypothetical protein
MTLNNVRYLQRMADNDLRAAVSSGNQRRVDAAEHRMALVEQIIAENRVDMIDTELEHMAARRQTPAARAHKFTFTIVAE